MLPSYKDIRLTERQRHDAARLMRKHAARYQSDTRMSPPSILDDGAYVLMGTLMMAAGDELKRGDRDMSIFYESVAMIIGDALALLRPDEEAKA